MKTFFVVSLYLSLISFITSGAFAQVTNDEQTLVEEGKFGQAKFLIVSREERPSKVLVLAHGSRLPFSGLSAWFDYHTPLYQNLLEQGWMIASTSYSGNHFIPHWVARDIREFHDLVIKRYPSIKDSQLMGTSLGADASLLIAESDEPDFSRVIALCASNYLGLYTDSDPKVPMLFISNQDEFPWVEDYLSALTEDSPIVASRKVLRDGHCKFNDLEVLRAMDEFARIRTGENLALVETLLIEEDKPPSQAVFNGEGFTTKIKAIDPVHGNITTTAVQTDLEKLNIQLFDDFAFECKGERIGLKLGNTYGDVWPTQWVGFFNDVGRLSIVRNFLSAADSIQCGEGDSLGIYKR